MQTNLCEVCNNLPFEKTIYFLNIENEGEITMPTLICNERTKIWPKHVIPIEEISV